VHATCKITQNLPKKGIICRGKFGGLIEEINIYLRDIDTKKVCYLSIWAWAFNINCYHIFKKISDSSLRKNCFP
jgi:energy-converting hydrogenase Eha subunit F